MNDSFKIIFLIVLSFASVYLLSEEDPLSEDEVLTVRTQFPRYRVLYDHQKAVQEVQNQLAEEQSEEELGKESSKEPSTKDKK